MDYDSAMRIWLQMRASALADLRQDLIELVVRYARLRVDCYFADAEQKRVLEDSRSTCHNALISSCDILARNMAKHGEDSRWRLQMGDDRKEIGDFACHLHAIIGLAAR
jgi:hypothetical protein